jgi:hypothetical protein
MKHLAQFAAQVAAMSDDQRAAIAARMPITTIEGRALSMRNHALCFMQNPTPITVVGGFKQWLGAGRCVKKGEKAMYILHPCAKKDLSGEDAGVYFREVPIFDVTQTQEIAE